MPTKVQVTFEFDVKTVAAMIEARSPKSSKLTKGEVEAMAKEGTLRAGDLLTKAEISSVVGMVTTLKMVDLGAIAASSTRISKLVQSKIEVPRVSALQIARQQVMFKAEKAMNAMVVAGGPRQKATRKS